MVKWDKILHGPSKIYGRDKVCFVLNVKLTTSYQWRNWTTLLLLQLSELLSWCFSILSNWNIAFTDSVWKMQLEKQLLWKIAGNSPKVHYTAYNVLFTIFSDFQISFPAEHLQEANLDACQTSMMEFYAKMVHGFFLLNIF